PRDAVLRQASFPTKLTTYVQAARPLLIHAPADSSVAPLAAREPSYAWSWETLRPEDGAAILERLWRVGDGLGNDLDASAHEAAERIRRAHFDADRNRRTLFEALDALARGSAHPSPEGR